EDGIRDFHVTGVQTCALPISAIPTGAQETATPAETQSEGPRAIRSAAPSTPATSECAPAKRRTIQRAPAAIRCTSGRSEPPRARSEERRVGKGGRHRVGSYET